MLFAKLGGWLASYQNIPQHRAHVTRFFFTFSRVVLHKSNVDQITNVTP